MKREFEFNLSTSATFDLDANSSSSVHQVSQDVMEEVSSDLQLFHTLSQPLKYGGLVLLAWSFLRSEITASGVMMSCEWALLTVCVCMCVRAGRFSTDVDIVVSATLTTSTSLPSLKRSTNR